ncbi:MAG: heavy metal-binding domain-containing protein, partial [Phenylobacterium sp.]|nr:heavy metal-binding domain-containing protein [Phenylobacterium sp.]
KGYERVLAQARADALKNLEAEARALGANAIVGVDLDYNTVGPNGSMLMVSVNGSAVIL